MKAEARTLFDERVRNREIKADKQRNYTKLMNKGDVDGGWRIAAVWDNPIKIDHAGKLVGGQHRMLAFHRSIQQYMLFAIQFNVSEIGRRLQDCNIVRSKGDAVDMFFPDPGWANLAKSKRVAAAKILYHVGNHPDDPYCSRNVTYHQIGEMLKKYKKSFEKLNDMFDKKPQRGILLSVAPYIAAAVYMHGKISNWEKAVEAMSNAAPDIDVFEELYERENQKDRDNETRRYARFINTIHAMYLFAQGKSCVLSDDYRVVLPLVA